MVNPDRALIAHLMRRAGFGVTGEELETLSLRPYEDIVEDLLHPERFEPVDEAVLSRYYGTLWEDPISAAAVWLYRMANTRRPLEEKTALFWHHVFATGNLKCEHPVSMINQIEMFRRFGLSDMRTLLVELSKDPAMIYWLDNNENHKGEPNENYGRELLELFSMGVGNYTETDIKMAARAFTGWTFTQPVPLYPHGRYPSEFAYREEDHDDSVKVFLGETGRLNGEDIVDIIVRQPAAARFISRHMYNFFVADEPQVPAWDATPPQDPAAVDALIQAYRDSNGNIRAVLRVLFNSDFFKEARYRRVKCPAELVAGLVKLTGIYRFPDLGIARLANATTVMGQTLMNPPTVEGWHTGREWIDGGTLTERVNFSAELIGDASKPGIASLIDRVCSGRRLSPEDVLDRCLEELGPVELSDQTKTALIRHAEEAGEITFDTEADREAASARVARILQLIVATKEYQFA